MHTGFGFRDGVVTLAGSAAGIHVFDVSQATGIDLSVAPMHTVRMSRSLAQAWITCCGERRLVVAGSPALAGFVPAGAELSVDGLSAYDSTLVRIDQRVFADAAIGAFDLRSIDLRCELLSEPGVVSLVDASRHIAQSGALAAWPLMAESVTLALAVAVLQQLSPSVIERAGDIGLSASRRARVVEYVDENLHLPVSLADLAGAASMSVFHFSRSFRKAVGLTPLQYLSHRRVVRAKRLLLRDADAPLATVALEAGFSGQSHLSTVFKAATGLTPGAFRRGPA